MRDIGQEILDGINEIKQGKQALRSTQRSQEKPNMIIPPCPCGGKARLHKQKYDRFPYCVKCDVCGATGCKTFSEDFAVYLWEEGALMSKKGNLLPRRPDRSSDGN